MRCLILVCLCFLILAPVNAAEFSQKLDLQTRADDRSSRDIRFQYRVRYKPQLVFSEYFSVHAFAATGDEFASSHNTIDADINDYFYLRRLYTRHSGNYGKTELGIIPTYKGRVSSSGLSKDGWIKGLRHVRSLGDNQVELVFGQLNSLDPKNALRLAEKLNYLEVEYSAKINDVLSYEFSAERMTEANFLRTELRFQYQPNLAVFAEIITKLNDSKIKTVLGAEGEFTLNAYQLEYFAHYSYVSEDFGLRAELTEDFLGTGHGFSGELSGNLALTNMAWFFRYDAIEDRTRFLAGIKWSL